MSRIKAIEQDWCDTSQTLEPAAPTTNCVFLHGFGGSPYDLEPLAESLYQQNHRCVIPIIDGQRNMHRRGASLSSTQIIENTRKQIALALSPTLPLILIGFSMGAALCVIHAQHFKPKAIVLLAPYFRLNQGRWLWEHLGSRMARFCPPVPKLSSGRIASREGRQKYRSGSQWLSVSSVVELDKIAGEARQAAMHLTSSTLWCHSTADPVADYQAAEACLPVGVEHLRLSLSEHVLLFDHEREAIIRSTSSFIQRFS